MTRFFLGPIGLYLILGNAAIAQVKIHVPEQHDRETEQIHATVENSGSYPVTFCIGFLSVIESTPSPFWVQRYSNGKWGTLMMGPDVGNFRTVVVLGVGESMEYLVRLDDSGRVRLRLNYWHNSIPNLNCHMPPRGSKLATSAVFTIN